MATKIVNKLGELLEEKGKMREEFEHSNGNHAYQWNRSRIKEETGLSLPTVKRWLDEDFDRMWGDTLVTWVDYLRSEPCSVKMPLLFPDGQPVLRDGEPVLRDVNISDIMQIVED